jgi:hypothetical protein
MYADNDVIPKPYFVSPAFTSQRQPRWTW